MWLSFALAVSYHLLKVVSSRNETNQERLVNSIFANYNKKLRPVENTADVINVTLNPALFSIVETNEANESITIIQWFRMMWTDIFISWNPNDYGGMNQLLVPITEIWYPDVFVGNMKDINVPIPEEKNYAIIDNDGGIGISIVQVVSFQCKFDIVMFPFDIQNCTTWVGSWMHTANQIDIWFMTPTDLDAYTNSSEWDLISMAARRTLVNYDAADIAFVNVYYDILIQRKPNYYLFTFVLPCFAITTISIVGIFAPFNDAGDREEKVTMALTTLLTMTVVVTLIADQMPKSSEGLPLLGTYVMLQIGIAAVTALLTVGIMYLNRKWTLGEPIPVWILKITRLYHKKENSSVQTSKHDLLHFNTKTNASTTTKPVICDLADAIKQQSIVIRDVQYMVKHLIEHIYNRKDEHSLRKDWQIASQRLDLILMIFFLVLSCIFTVSFLVIGQQTLYALIKIAELDTIAMASFENTAVSMEYTEVSINGHITTINSIYIVPTSVIPTQPRRAPDSSKEDVKSCWTYCCLVFGLIFIIVFGITTILVTAINFKECKISSLVPIGLLIFAIILLLLCLPCYCPGKDYDYRKRLCYGITIAIILWLIFATIAYFKADFSDPNPSPAPAYPATTTENSQFYCDWYITVMFKLTFFGTFLFVSLSTLVVIFYNMALQMKRVRTEFSRK